MGVVQYTVYGGVQRPAIRILRLTVRYMGWLQGIFVLAIGEVRYLRHLRGARLRTSVRHSERLLYDLWFDGIPALQQAGN